METQPNYREPLDRVTAYLHAILATDIRIEALSNVACLSSYHWRRIYKAMTGETLHLHRAADHWANPDRGISMIAQLAQYGSQDALSRAFRDPYGKLRRPYRQGGSHAAFKAANASADANGVDLSPARLSRANTRQTYRPDLRGKTTEVRLFEKARVPDHPIGAMKKLSRTILPSATS